MKVHNGLKAEYVETRCTSDKNCCLNSLRHLGLPIISIRFYPECVCVYIYIYIYIYIYNVYSNLFIYVWIYVYIKSNELNLNKSSY